MKTVLVTGGAGFVGSQTVLHLQESGYRVVVLDDLSTGHRTFGELADRFIVGRVEDSICLNQIFTEESVAGVVHCAAKALVEESTREPLAYYRANVGSFGVLLQALVKHGTPPVVFSSSATVYGAPSGTPISEASPTEPINPYGGSKLAAERLLAACGVTYGLSGLSLRYFNAAGADPHGRVGEWHAHETHVIPNLLQAAFDGEAFEVRGTDWPTPDGSCIRDYVHTVDLAQAHRLALEYLWAGGQSMSLNIGTGTGTSVLELVEIVSKLTGRKIRVKVSERRSGDAPILTACTQKAADVLGFRPQHSGIGQIVGDAMNWMVQLREDRAD